MSKPIMTRATAVWLIDNTALTFKQIGDFVGLHELEIQGIADGDVDETVRGFDPVVNNQLDAEEIKRGESDPVYALKLKHYAASQGEVKRHGPRYTPLSKRQERPAAIYWLTKFHPELSDAQISKLVGTTKPTITSIKDRSHWNISNIQPIDPVALGFCKQSELDREVQKAAKKRAKEQALDGVGTKEEGGVLASTEQSLARAVADEKTQATDGREGGFLVQDAPESAPTAPEQDPRLAAEAAFRKSSDDTKDDA